jgi:Helicase conserved C-terminal domain
MKGLQNTVYKKVSAIESDLYSAAQQASLFVFPDGSYGGQGFSKYFRRVEKNTSSGTKSVYLISNPEFVPAVQTNLPNLSVKYSSVISLLNSAPTELAFVYGEYVEGSGLVVLAKILEANGYTRSNGKETTEGLRYGIVTNMTTTVKNTRTLLSLFNSNKNRYGKYVRVILGSRMISEGFTLKNVRQAHILTPHWNYGKIDQAIARTFRAFSHDALISDGVNPILRVYQYAAIDSNGASIDIQMYRVSEQKDLMIKQVERVVKEAAVDCQIFKNQNTLPESSNNTRACEYQSCTYTCDGQYSDLETIDYSTANLYYPDDDADQIYTDANKSLSLEPYLIPNNSQYPLSALVVSRTLEKFKPIQMGQSVGYVHIDGRTLYTSLSRFETPDVGNMFYFKNPSKYFRRDIESLALKYLYKYRVPNILKNMCTTKEYDVVKLLMNELPDNVKQILLEYSLLSTTQTAFSKTVIDLLSKYVHTTSNNMLVNSVGGKMRCFYTDVREWRDCPSDISEEVLSSGNTIETRAKDFGYYGVLDKNKFLIKTVGVEDVTDKRKAARGRVCSTIDRSDLDEIAKKAGLSEYSDIGKRELCLRLQEWFDGKSLMLYK